MPVVGALILAVAIIIGFSAHMLSKKTDSPIEQVSEAVIKMESGVDVDFSAADLKDLESHKPD